MAGDWRASRWKFWVSDGATDDRLKKQLGKEGWDLGDRATKANPNGAEGLYFALLADGQFGAARDWAAQRATHVASPRRDAATWLERVGDAAYYAGDRETATRHVLGRGQQASLGCLSDECLHGDFPREIDRRRTVLNGHPGKGRVLAAGEARRLPQAAGYG